LSLVQFFTPLSCETTLNWHKTSKTFIGAGITDIKAAQQW